MKTWLVYFWTKEGFFPEVIALNLVNFHSSLTFRAKIGIFRHIISTALEIIHVKVEMSGKLLTALFSREGHKSRLSIAQFWIWPWPWGPSQAYFFTNDKQIAAKVAFWNKDILVFSIIDCVFASIRCIITEINLHHECRHYVCAHIAHTLRAAERLWKRRGQGKTLLLKAGPLKS